MTTEVVKMDFFKTLFALSGKTKKRRVVRDPKTSCHYAPGLAAADEVKWQRSRLYLASCGGVCPQRFLPVFGFA